VETENHLELKKEAEKRKLHRMAKVYDCWEMWQCSQNLRATQNECGAHYKQMTTGIHFRYRRDHERILVNCQHVGGAVFKLSVRSPLPRALSAKDLSAGRTQELNVHRIRRIDCHRSDSDEDSAPKCIFGTGN
jgi:hypothetical protein